MKTIQVQVAFTLDADAAKVFAELLAPAIRQALGLADGEADETKNARLRASRNG